jgi:Zn ribbon nucleic-acid-binding protein
MIKICRTSGQPFEITDDDLKFYEKMGVPPPTLCPEERQRRRLAWRNERNLYHRTCDATGKKIISMFSPEKPFPVYCNDYWWSDQWDARDYGKDFDFTRPFFEQFYSLLLRAPRFNLYAPFSQNSEYTNHSYRNKDCYLIFNTAHNENVYYSSNLIYKCQDCSDCMTIERSQLLYESMYVKNSFQSIFLFHSSGCRDSAFLFDCRNCADCFLCSNLRNKQYYFKNKPFSEPEYKKLISEYHLGNHNQVEMLKKSFYEYLRSTSIHRNLYMENSEDCSGDYIFHSQNVAHSFYADKCKKISYCYDALENTNCMDTYESSLNCEFQYECYASNESNTMKFCALSQFSHNLEYCDCCFSCSNCFACIGLKNAQYCILNKQYSKEEYFTLREKIIEHMKKTPLNPPLTRGRQAMEWGEFFPIELSPFAYNETVAQEYFPLTKEEALQKGYRWKDDEPGAKYDGPKVEIPETIAETPDDICNQILTCETCSKNYRIVKPELAFYRKMNLPVPHNCPDCRHKARMALRNPRKLWKRNCDNCGVDMETTFSPERPEKVFCEKCYLESV